MYSLGYQCVYVSGYVIKNKDYFDEDDGHAWSLIKVNGKWLPFDATWGIFSGKLPVCHVFVDYFSRSLHLIGTDGARFGKRKINGKFVGANVDIWSYYKLFLLNTFLVNIYFNFFDFL